MEQMVIRGGNRLVGSVKIEGAKNSILPILSASILAEVGTVTLHNVPAISDVFSMIVILRCLNIKIDFNERLKRIDMDTTQAVNCDTAYFYECMGKIRQSVLLMGPLLARYGYTKIKSLGGCAIGKRPIDMHLNGFQALSARVIENNEFETVVVASSLIGETVYLEFPSVGATQNIMMAATKAKGTTVILNAAREPEVVDLANFLNKMGSKISGAGTNRIQIHGVERLFATRHTIIQDRVEAGTFMIAAAITRGDVLIEGAVIEHNMELINKLTEAGAVIRNEDLGVRVVACEIIKPTNIITSPYPGFPTDLQSPMSAVLMLADGASVISETVFENRFQHLKEMKRMNGIFEIVHENMAIVKGNNFIKGANVFATDLRAAAALVLLGLRAKGVTRVSNLNFLDRGYSNFHKKLKKLGADVERVIN